MSGLIASIDGLPEAQQSTSWLRIPPRTSPWICWTSEIKLSMNFWRSKHDVFWEKIDEKLKFTIDCNWLQLINSWQANKVYKLLISIVTICLRVECQSVNSLFNAELQATSYFDPTRLQRKCSSRLIFFSSVCLFNHSTNVQYIAEINHKCMLEYDIQTKASKKTLLV